MGKKAPAEAFACPPLLPRVSKASMDARVIRRLRPDVLAWRRLEAENVGSQFHSLRQPVRVQHSPLTCETAEIPNKYGASRANLRTAIELLSSKTPSLRPIFSKAPDCADLVRNS